MRSDEREDAGRNDRKVAREERPGAQAQRGNVAVAAERQKCFASDPVDQGEAGEGEHQIGDADAHRLEQGGLRAQTGQGEDPRREIQYRIDSGELVEKRKQKGQ